MNQDAQNIYEAYVTESPEEIAKIDKRIARLQSQKAQLQQSGTPTTSSSTSTTTTGTASSRRGTSNRDINNRAKANAADAAKRAASNKTQNASNWANYGPGAAAFQSGAGQFDTAPAQEPKSVQPKIDQPKDAEDTAATASGEAERAESPENFYNGLGRPPVSRNRNSPERIAALQKRQAENPGVGPDRTFGTGAPSDEESAAASAAIDSGEISSKPAGTEFDPWRQEQMRINKTAEMPDNWRNASWAKRARTMGGRNPARVKALAQKEWERKEAMRKEREMATSELNPNRQTGAQYLGNQLKKMPGNISAGLQGLGSAIFGKNKIPQTTAAGDAVRDANGKLQWKDNSTGKPGLFQRAGGAVKKALTPSKPAAPATAPTKPAAARQYHNKQFQKTLSPRERMNMRPGSRGYNQAYNKYLKTATTPINASYNAFDAVLQDKNVDHLID